MTTPPVERSEDVAERPAEGGPDGELGSGLGSGLGLGLGLGDERDGGQSGAEAGVRTDGEWRMPPGLPRSLPFYFHKPWAKIGQPIRLFEHLQKVYGRVACYRFMGTWIVFVNDPEMIREILINRAPAFVKERTLKRMKILLGEGLITSDDPIHMRQRKIAAPAFHRQRIQAYAGQIVLSAEAHAAGWREGQEIDIHDAMMRLSLEITARTLFDTEVNADVRSINDEVNLIMGIYNYLIAFPALERVLHWPIPGVVKFRRSRARLDGIVNRIVVERRREIAAGADDRGDLLSMLLASRYEAEDAGAGQEGMTDRQVRDEVLTIFLAGYETVANAMAWTWYLLSQNASVEKEMQAELDRVLGVLGDAGERRLPTLADYPELKYTEQVFAEAMRLYPPAWAMGRMSTEAVELGPYRIPPGAHFFFSQYVMHRSEEFWAEPLKFDPGRHTAEAKAARPKFVYFPFGGGGRQCIGESFAWMEGVLAIATVASRWRMEYLGVREPELQAKITLRPKEALRMRLVGRG